MRETRIPGIIIGLLANAAGSAYIARAIIKDRSVIAEAKESAR